MEGSRCRSRGLSGLALGHPSLPAPHHCCQADASGLCPAAIPGDNNTREEVARCPVPSPLQGAMLSPGTFSHGCLLLPTMPAACARGWCRLCPLLLCLLPAQPGCQPAFPVPFPTSLPAPSGSALPTALLGGDAGASSISASAPNGVSTVTFIYFRSQPQAFALDFFIWGKKILLEAGRLAAGWVFTHLSLTCFVLVPVGRPRTCRVQHELCAGFALEGGCSEQGGSPSSAISPL